MKPLTLDRLQYLAVALDTEFEINFKNAVLKTTKLEIFGSRSNK